MIDWLRRITPDLFLAAVVALLITLALAQLDRIESDRIVGSVRWAAHEGLTVDERLGVFERSIRRSIFIHQPILVAVGAICVGLVCRNRQWAWLTAVLAVIPALLIGGGFFIDAPVAGFVLLASYVAIAVILASGGVAVRERLAPAPKGLSG